jgi:hypothetical protein
MGAMNSIAQTQLEHQYVFQVGSLQFMEVRQRSKLTDMTFHVRSEYVFEDRNSVSM